MTSSQTTTYPGMHVTIPNPYPPTSSMALHPQQPLGFLNIGNQVQTGQLSFITSPGIFTTSQLGLENVPMVHPAPGITTTNTNFKDAAIALGAVHIIIGLMHIGFGTILGLMSTYVSWTFSSTAFVGGYPFWGGVSFIVSGSLSISAFKKFSPCLVKSTLVMNIISAICAFVGVVLLLWDLNINGYNNQNYVMVLSGKGISGVLAMFSFLDFSIASVMAYFANQTMLHGNRSVLAVPTVYAANPLMQESFPDPPSYDSIPPCAPRQ
ncbi:membrane-spanning 4-domains subfamily A member 12 [Peromyscus californicus insignis]|uniref:membrane-spanning 4-domains subfamily A member 12 n=1 Tax=Peromyscus californicus insignis TaxID=564181 RepID=UPI0022A7415F|nr:membrane-spanning 4-domains subfamily A member 12 [Peromyscus californicus insignis]